MSDDGVRSSHPGRTAGTPYLSPKMKLRRWRGVATFDDDVTFAVARTPASVQPGAPRHERRDENDHHDQCELGGVEASVGIDWESRRGGVFAARRANADERHHRRQLQNKDRAEQGELGPEQAVVPVEGRLLPAVKDASQTGGDPQYGGDAPRIVGCQQTVPSCFVERARQRAAARIDRTGTERERQQMDSGEQGGYDQTRAPGSLKVCIGELAAVDASLVSVATSPIPLSSTCYSCST